MKPFTPERVKGFFFWSPAGCEALANAGDGLTQESIT
jgi:hypothetical protein